MSTTGIKENQFKYFENLIVLNYLKQKDLKKRKTSKKLIIDRLNTVYDFLVNEMYNFSNYEINQSEYVDKIIQFIKDRSIQEDDEYFYFSNTPTISSNTDISFTELLLLFKLNNQTGDISSELLKKCKKYLTVIEKNNSLAITNVKQKFVPNFFDSTSVSLTPDFINWDLPEYMTLLLYKKKI